MKKCMSRQARRSVCCRITSTNGMYATPLARWHRFLPTRLPEWTYGSPRLERYNGIPSMEILGEAAAGKKYR